MKYHFLILLALSPVVAESQSRRVLFPTKTVYVECGINIRSSSSSKQSGERPLQHSQPVFPIDPTIGFNVVFKRGWMWGIQFSTWETKTRGLPDLHYSRGSSFFFNWARGATRYAIGTLLAGYRYPLAARPGLHFGFAGGPYAGIRRIPTNPHTAHYNNNGWLFPGDYNTYDISLRPTFGLQMRSSLDLITRRKWGVSLGLSGWVYKGGWEMRPEVKLVEQLKRKP